MIGSEIIRNSKRIPKDVEEILLKALNDKRALMSPEQREEFDNNYKETYANQHLYVRKNRNSGINTKRINYEVLPLFLEASGISYAEMFALISDVKCDWKNEYERGMNKFLDKASNAQLRFMKDLFYSLLPDELINYIEQDVTRTEKVMRVVYYLYDKGAVQMMRNIGLEYSWTHGYAQRNFENTFPLEKLPAISQVTGVPIHWLCNFDENAVILSSSSKVESVMDWFCFLPEDYQRVIYLGVVGGDSSDQ